MVSGLMSLMFDLYSRNVAQNFTRDIQYKFYILEETASWDGSALY
jgi:hypothetical protein